MGEHEDAQRREQCRVLIRRFLVHHFADEVEAEGPRSVTFVVDSGRYRLRVAHEFLEDSRPDEETDRWLEDLKVVERMRGAPNGVVFIEVGPNGTPTVRVLRYEG